MAEQKKVNELAKELKIINENEMKKIFSQELAEIELSKKKVADATAKLNRLETSKEDLSAQLIDKKKHIAKVKLDYEKSGEKLSAEIIDAERTALAEVTREIQLADIQEKRLEMELKESTRVAREKYTAAIEHREKAKELEDELLSLSLTEHQEDLERSIGQTDDKADAERAAAVKQEQLEIEKTRVINLANRDEAIQNDVALLEAENARIELEGIEGAQAAIDENLGKKVKRSRRGDK